MRTLEKGVAGRRHTESGGHNPLGFLKVKMNAP